MLPQDGLTEEIAFQKLKEFGPNVLPENPPPKDVEILISQFKNPLVYVLVVAMVLTVFLKHTPDAIIIFVAVLLNTTLGFFQERRASRALEALKKITEFKSYVVRNGKLKKIPAAEIVPMDIVMLSQGAKIPADGKLLNTNRFSVDEAILTGEDFPVNKRDGDMAYSGTICTTGKAFLLVEKTGSQSRIGGIAKRVGERREETPLKKQLSHFSNQLLILVLILTVGVSILGLVTGGSIYEVFSTAVALAVSSIPEGLLVAFTVVLAIGMQRILKRKGLVRKLASAETLGSVTTICIDKTGTLTEGKIKVAEVVGNEEKIAQQIVLASDLDNPLSTEAFRWAVEKLNLDTERTKEYQNSYFRVDSLPFSSKDKFFAALNASGSIGNTIHITGAPEYLIEWSSLEESEKQRLMRQINTLAGQGRRVVAFAKKGVEKDVVKLDKKQINNLEWVGLMAFTDPIRPGVEVALTEARRAGLDVKVVTGDYLNTALFILDELGISLQKDEVMEGKELQKLSDEDLARMIKKIKLFARVTPEDKFRIVSALKNKSEVVAMMGDGVNDAPALNKADIGIVVGDASDVARETADLVLLDSNFTTIVAAIEEGRSIFDNLRKIILYLLSDAFEEITAVVGAIVLNLPLPVTAAQILWINLVSDGLPDLALTIDPKRENIMQTPPRPMSEPLVTGWMKSLIGIVSVTSGILTLLFFVVVFQKTKDVSLARSAAFLTLGINSLVYVFSIRTLTTPFWKTNIFANKWLLLAVLGGVILQALPFLTPQTRNFFGVVSLDWCYWLASLSLALFMFGIVEVLKQSFANHKAKNLRPEAFVS